MSRPYVLVPNSRQCVAVLQFLYKGGYIAEYKILTPSIIKIKFKYFKGKSYIKGLVVYSKPSREVRYSASTLNQALDQTNIVVLSSNYGLIYGQTIIDEVEWKGYATFSGIMLFGLSV